MFAVIFLICLPPLAFLAASTQPEIPFLKQSSQSAQWLGFVGVLLVVPAFLLLLSMNSSSAYLLGFAFSAAGALCGAYIINRYLLIVAFVLLCFPSSLLTMNVLSIFGGFAAGVLLGNLLSKKLLWWFLLSFAALDCLIVFGGLTEAAVANLPLPGVFSTTDFSSLPIYNRIEVSSMMLGAGDIAYAALVAYAVQRRKLFFVYFAATAIFIGFGVAFSLSLPATVPGLVVLLVFKCEFWVRPQKRVQF